MAKLTKSAIKTITETFYGTGHAMRAWAQESGEHRFVREGAGTATKYYYRDYLLDLIPIAEVFQGCNVRINPRRTFPVSIEELMPVMATSVMHHKIIRTNCFSVEVRSLETLICSKFKAISKYIDVYLGEYEDVILGCSKRELIVRVKEEYYRQLPLVFRHALVDKRLTETPQSRKVRNERRIFANS